MYTIKEAAIRAGVTVPLLRAWELRYGIVQPARTASGYRLYDEPAIQRVRAMRRLVDAGWSPSQAARQIEIEGLPPQDDASSGTAVPGRTEARASSELNLAAAFVEAATILDEQRIESILDDLFASGSFERVVDDLLMPALRGLGERWAAGSLSVGAEHAASHAVLRRLSASFEAAGRAFGDKAVLVGLPPGSRHEIGALAFATALRRRGMAVIYLGADVPPDSWLEAASRTSARAVVIGIPTESDCAAAEQVVRAATGVAGLLVAVGGPGAAKAAVPRSVVRLPDGIGESAGFLESALAQTAA